MTQGLGGFLLLLGAGWGFLLPLGTGWGWGCASGCRAGDGAGFKCVLFCLFVSQRGFISFSFDPGSRLQDLISPVMASQENTPVLCVCQDGFSGFGTACLLQVYGLSRYFPVLS